MCCRAWESPFKGSPQDSADSSLFSTHSSYDSITILGDVQPFSAPAFNRPSYMEVRSLQSLDLYCTAVLQTPELAYSQGVQRFSHSMRSCHHPAACARICLLCLISTQPANCPRADLPGNLCIGWRIRERCCV